MNPRARREQANRPWTPQDVREALRTDAGYLSVPSQNPFLLDAGRLLDAILRFEPEAIRIWNVQGTTYVQIVLRRGHPSIGVSTDRRVALALAYLSARNLFQRPRRLS